MTDVISKNNQELRSTITEYLEGLSSKTSERLFSTPVACLAIFRLLSSIEKQFIMSILYIDNPLTSKEVSSWAKPGFEGEIITRLGPLRKLHIIEKRDGGLVLNEIFRNQLKNALTGGGDYKSFGVLSNRVSRDNIEQTVLDNYALKKWESILHYMVGTDAGAPKPSGTVLKLMVRARLMEEATDYQSGGTKLKISNKGFQFLLQDVNSQVWTIILQYLRQNEEQVEEEKQGIHVVEILNFLFQLSSLEVGQAYIVESLTPVQRRMLSDLREFGLAYQSRDSDVFYPTRLVTVLSSIHSNSASGSLNNITVGQASTNITIDQQSDSSGFILLETNYCVYAYTDSPLQISILNLFVELQGRFPNLVTGRITRDSVKSAFRNGITADQIIMYMTAHAHPHLRTQTPTLPITVTDQIRLWEDEKDRVRGSVGFLYSDFNKPSDFDIIYNYAKKLNVVLWHDDNTKQMVIAEEGHNAVKAYFKSKMSKQGRPSSQGTR
ncbi:RNA polymerase II transcription factor B 52 kDa subunit [Mycoemilia scoparia]|uniref:RNA polymerase II transcription factor B subunit 2 n=1 Tax=Mycoemilia scoparia TaxID=417184 RepID=A0A9W8DTH7_9FUNG|nr:RNA polymerase II transcription factor B 52 kDa subunit [Mycoemilia scoparia]